MSQTLSFIELAQRVLEQATEPLTTMEIWQRACELGLDKELRTTGKTPFATLGARLYMSLKKPNSPFVATDDSPKRFALATKAFAPLAPPPPQPSAPTPVAPTIPSPEPTPFLLETVDFLSIAERVLNRLAGKKPLHYQVIVQKAIDKGWIPPEALYDAKQLYQQIELEILQRRRKGAIPRFCKTSDGFVALTAWDDGGVNAIIQKNHEETRQRLHDKLVAMSPEGFEELISRLLVAMGFREVSRTRLSHDGGIDVKGTMTSANGMLRYKLAVQVKKWRNNVQTPIVQQIRGSLGAHEQGCIVTTSDFSKGAREEAQRANCTPITLINGDELVELLIEHRIGVRKRSVSIYTVSENLLEEAEGEID